MNLKSAHTAKIGKAFIKARILRSLTQEEIANLTLINIDYWAFQVSKINKTTTS